MKTFKDLKDRKYNLTITVGAVKRVRRALDLDITDLGKDGFIGKIQDNPELMVDMFWILLEKQAAKIKWTNEDNEDVVGVDEEEFGEGFAGNAIDDAIKAFNEEIVDFFPEKKRQATRILFEKQAALMEKGFEKIGKDIQELDLEPILAEVFSQDKESPTSNLTSQSQSEDGN